MRVKGVVRYATYFIGLEGWPHEFIYKDGVRISVFEHVDLICNRIPVSQFCTFVQARFICKAENNLEEVVYYFEKVGLMNG